MILAARASCLLNSILLMMVSCGLPAARAENTGLRVTFCPAAPLWTYPLDEVHGVNSLLLQNLGILNTGQSTVVTAVDLDLMYRGRRVDRRTITNTDLQGLKAAGPQLTPLLKAFPSQFCGTDMIPTAFTLGGETLHRAEAMLVLQEPFAFSGRRDFLQVTVHGRARHRNLVYTASIPIHMGFAPGSYVYPVRGTSYVANGPSFHTAHRWGVSEEFALDIVKLGANSQTHSGDGLRFQDYFAYGAEVRSVADGQVVEVVSTEPESEGAMIQPSETKEQYFSRLQRDQEQRMSRGARGLAGNFIVIDQGKGVFAFYAHLRPGTLVVAKNHHVVAGELLAGIGSSGNSTEPHLHFQLCSGPNLMNCAGIPVSFRDINLPLVDNPRALQSGDVVVTH